MRRRDPLAAETAGDTPGPFVFASWLPLVGKGVAPMMRRVHARRLWEAAWADWGRRRGYDPDALYDTAEGRRWSAARRRED